MKPETYQLHRRLLVCTIFIAATLGSAQGLFGPIQAGDTAAFNSVLHAGADINAADEYGQTPLMYAVTFNQPDMVEALIAAGADVNARTLAGWTALHYAARDASHTRLLEALLAAGADPTAQNQDGDTAKDLASATGNQVAAIALQDVDTPGNNTGSALPTTPPVDAAGREAAEGTAQRDEPPGASETLMERFSRLVGERPEDMAWQNAYPRRTGEFEGWYTAFYTTGGWTSNARVYVANVELGEYCAWTVDLFGTYIYPNHGSPVDLRLRFHPSFNYSLGNVQVALVANQDTGRCERR